MRLVFFAALGFAALLPPPAAVAQQLPAETQARIAEATRKILADTGVPSASVGIVQNGRIVYTQAFGDAHRNPTVPATSQMAYPVGSISKQFTATALLLLQQDGKLSLDDKVARYFPNLTRANDITLRNLLTMTSGYEDYAPQDYIIPAWMHEESPLNIINAWATKPLDFEPGTRWQYSNTNFVLAALIAEKVSGQPLARFLALRVFRPLKMEGVFNTYTQRQQLQVTGYVSYALAPPREQPLEGNGWYYGDGDLAMPASTLLTWDLSLINHSLLTLASYTQMETSAHLANGDDTSYGLGIFTRIRKSADEPARREIEHGGEVGGFVAENVVYPDDKAAIVVLTNEVASSAASLIAAAIKPLILPPPTAPPAAATPADTFGPTLQTILTGFQTGQIDRTLFTADANAYFDTPALADFRATLSTLGTATATTRLRTALRGGMTFGLYKVTFSSGTSVIVNTYLMPDGKIEQLLVIAKT